MFRGDASRACARTVPLPEFEPADMRCHERPDVVSSRREVAKPPVAFAVLGRRRGNGRVRAEETVQRLDVPRESLTTGLGIRFHASPGLEERASAFMLGEEFEESECLRREAPRHLMRHAASHQLDVDSWDVCGADCDHDEVARTRHVEAQRTVRKLGLAAGRRSEHHAIRVAVHVSREDVFQCAVRYDIPLPVDAAAKPCGTLELSALAIARASRPSRREHARRPATGARQHATARLNR